MQKKALGPILSLSKKMFTLPSIYFTTETQRGEKRGTEKKVRRLRVELG